MTSLVTAELGTKENPHPITPPVKDRIKGHYYMYKNDGVRYWNGLRLNNKEKIKERMKEYRKNNKEKRKEYKKEYYEKNKEKRKEYHKGYREKNKEKRKEYHKVYREKNKEKRKEYQKGYREKNKEKIKEKSKEYREKNKEKRKEYHKGYRENNKEKRKEYREKNKEQRNEWERRRRKNDPVYRLTMNTRCRVWTALKSQNASKNQRTMEYIHCSVAHLYYHIEQQFGDSGMNWDNMGREDGEGGRGWEVDHRRPCDSFDLNDEEQKYMCFHWTNLQPMWGEENNKKRSSYDPETFQYKWIDRETGWVGIPSYLMN